MSGNGGVPALLLDEPGDRRWRGRISERSRWLKSANPKRRPAALNRTASMSICAALLAGGESRRMGKDKATMLFRGQPLWKIQLDLLRKLKPEEICISARNDPRWRPDDVKFVADEAPSRGPLSGIAATFDEMRSTHLLTLAIAMPVMNETYWRSLSAFAASGGAVVPRIHRRPQP